MWFDGCLFACCLRLFYRFACLWVYVVSGCFDSLIWMLFVVVICAWLFGLCCLVGCIWCYMVFVCLFL